MADQPPTVSEAVLTPAPVPTTTTGTNSPEIVSFSANRFSNAEKDSIEILRYSFDYDDFNPSSYPENMHLQKMKGDLTASKRTKLLLNQKIIVDPESLEDDDRRDEPLDVCVNQYREIRNNSHRGIRRNHLLFLAAEALRKHIWITKPMITRKDMSLFATELEALLAVCQGTWMTFPLDNDEILFQINMDMYEKFRQVLYDIGSRTSQLTGRNFDW